MGAIIASLFLRPRPTADQVNKFGLALPTTIHKVLLPEEIGDKEVLIIGDVHGCLDELKELIDMHVSSKDNTVFLFCGDIVNKGPHNNETLQYVKNLPNCHVVRGNHEEHILRHYYAMKKDPSVAETVSAKYDWVTELTEDDADYLLDLPYTISVPSLNALIVHAGLNPWVPLYQQRLDQMVLMRDIVNPDGEQPYGSKSLGDGLPWASCWTGPQHVYFGHDARRGLQKFPLATGLDTGCVYGGSLAAKYLTGSKKLLLVKAHKMHRTPNVSIPSVQ